MPKKCPPSQPRRAGRPCGEISLDAATTEAARFGARLRKLRTAAGLTIRAASASAGVPETRWGDWEHGRGTPPIWSLGTITTVLGCGFEELIEEGE